jgi:hypothetical protein
MLVGNGIPEENWTATMLSDGSGTAGWLSSTYNVDNVDEKYESMIENWQHLKYLVAHKGYSNDLLYENTLYLDNEGDQYSLLS